MCRLIEKLQALPVEHRESLEDLCKGEIDERSSVEESVAKLHNSFEMPSYFVSTCCQAGAWKASICNHSHHSAPTSDN